MLRAKECANTHPVVCACVCACVCVHGVLCLPASASVARCVAVVQRVGYTLWMDNAVKSRRAPAFGMTMVVYNLENLTSH